MRFTGYDLVPRFFLYYMYRVMETCTCVYLIFGFWTWSWLECVNLPLPGYFHLQTAVLTGVAHDWLHSQAGFMLDIFPTEELAQRLQQPGMDAVSVLHHKPQWLCSWQCYDYLYNFLWLVFPPMRWPNSFSSYCLEIACKSKVIILCPARFS